ncbi:MAG TPA: universal stress protein [Thermodesulfobacteriota bacterium]|nr:universal stress protein [Thermodesulfobacteriota bacterium]
MFKNILVPVDLTKKNKQALDIAVKIGLHAKSKIYLLHVVQTIASTSFSEFEDFYRTLEERAKKNIDKLITPYKKNKLPMEGKITFGNRVAEILSFASKNKIDLIVMNSHKITPKEPTEHWGTISYKVGILSQCPVMLVK